MKSMFLSLILLLSAQANAVTAEQRKIAFEAQTACDNVIQFDQTNLYLGFGQYLQMGATTAREPIPGKLEVIEIENPQNKKTLTALDGIVGIRSVGDQLYVLTFTGLEQWDMNTWQRVGNYKTYDIGRELQNREHARGLYYYNGQFVVAHGKLGFSIIDEKTKAIVKQFPLDVNPDRPNLTSQAMDVDGQGSIVVFAVDSLSLVDKTEKPAFRGALVFELTTQKIVAMRNGFDPGVMGINVIDGKVMAAFHPAIWKMDLQTMISKNALGVQKIAYSFPNKGWGREKAFFDEENVYMCYRDGVYQAKFRPQAIKRSSVGL